MPINKNALIRYKTINDCLSTGRGYTIEELIEKCSAALAEYCGKYEGVSERTVRDDIRVMRSDMLGFNAPIIIRDGYYFYSDPSYSLLNSFITDEPLIDKLLDLLTDFSKKVAPPEIFDVIKGLQRAKLRISGGKISPGRDIDQDETGHGIPGLLTFETVKIPGREIKWEDIFRILTKKY